MRLLSSKFRQHPRRHAFRYELGQHDAVLLLSLLGAVCGVITGLIIALFRWGIDLATAIWSDHDLSSQSDGFELLGTEARFWLPIIGALILGIIMHSLKPENRFTGLNHVVTRLHRDDGKLPLKNAVLQFFGGIIALASGQSGGREGPAIHLGAAANSAIAKRLHLPHNTLRTLAACGTAAAIGASFNTPIAGVIFAMEVVLMEYTVVGFIPVILSSITATTLTQMLFGSDQSFFVDAMQPQSLKEFPYLLLTGLACGIAGLLFIRIQTVLQKFRRTPIMIRFLCAGLITASLGIYFPQILGIGYDTISLTLQGEIGLTFLICLCIGKIISSAITTGVGMPVGIVGPSLFIGACIGGSMGIISAEIHSGQTSSIGFYTLLGMGGMMSAVLNAPLAALIAILELAHTPAALLPGITVIVIASLFTDQIFGQGSAVETVLARQGISLRMHPVAQALSRISLSAVIDTNVQVIRASMSHTEIAALIENESRWLVVESSLEPGNLLLISRKDYSAVWQEYQLDQAYDYFPETKTAFFDYLKQARINSYSMSTISINATVKAARNRLIETQSDALFIDDKIGGLKGILRRDSLNKLIDSW